MIGRAGRPGFDTQGRAVVLVELSKKNFYKRFLYTPFPVESCLRERLCENLNAEIASGTISSLLDAVAYLTWTFFARRVKANPSYYGASGNTNEEVESFLTDITVEALSKLKGEYCVSMDDGSDIKSTILGQASSEYYLNHKTPKQILFGLKQLATMIHQELSVDENSVDDEEQTVTSAMKQLHPVRRTGRLEELTVAWILYTLCSTHEYDELPVRHNEDLLNQDLANEVMWGGDTSSLLDESGGGGNVQLEVYSDSHTKAFLLIQAWMEKTQLPISDYVNDTKTVLDSGTYSQTPERNLVSHREIFCILVYFLAGSLFEEIHCGISLPNALPLLLSLSAVSMIINNTQSLDCWLPCILWASDREKQSAAGLKS